MYKKQLVLYSYVLVRYLALRQVYMPFDPFPLLLLLVDTSNDFNSLNRQTALCNIQRLCPSLATALINTYMAPSERYIDGDVLLSQEGTTQGDLLVMPMYALATITLIRKLKNSMNDVNHLCCADDASGAGKINRLHEWWDLINTKGLKFGYFTNTSKTWLFIKEGYLLNAVAAFADLDVKVTAEGRPYVGAALGTEEYTDWQSLTVDGELELDCQWEGVWGLKTLTSKKSSVKLTSLETIGSNVQTFLKQVVWQRKPQFSAKDLPHALL